MEANDNYRKKITIVSLIVTVFVSVLLTSVMLTYANNKIIISTDEEYEEVIVVNTAYEEENARINTISLEELTRPVIVVDAFHGGNDSGTKAGETLEKDITLSIANKIEELSKEKNYTVLLTRTKDITLNTETRIKLVNRVDADYYIGIHLSSNAEDVREFGMSAAYNPTFYFDDFENAEFADTLLRETVLCTSNKALGLFEASDAEVILKVLDMPAVVLSPGYLSNADEEKLLTSDAYIEKIATGILNAMDSIVGSDK